MTTESLCFGLCWVYPKAILSCYKVFGTKLLKTQHYIFKYYHSIKTLMRVYIRETGPTVLRLAMALILIHSGISSLFYGTVPTAYALVLPESFIFAFSIVEVCIGVLFLAGLFTSFTASIATILYLTQFISLAYYDLFVVTNTILLAAAVSLIMTGAGRFSLDQQIFEKRGFL